MWERGAWNKNIECAIMATDAPQITIQAGAGAADGAQSHKGLNLKPAHT